MQNKPNFQKSQMNVSIFSIMAYENISNRTLGENKPKTKPIKPNFRKAKMNANVFVTKDYRKNDAFAVQKNKPNSNPISEKPKMNISSILTKYYENVPLRRRAEFKAKQSQSGQDQEAKGTGRSTYLVHMSRFRAIEKGWVRQ